jgi:hypothetical protein
MSSACCFLHCFILALVVWHNYLLLLRVEMSSINSMHRYVRSYTKLYYTLLLCSPSHCSCTGSIDCTITNMTVTRLLVTQHYTGILHPAFVKLHTPNIAMMVPMTSVSRSCIHSTAKYCQSGTVNGITIHIIFSLFAGKNVTLLLLLVVHCIFVNSHQHFIKK